MSLPTDIQNIIYDYVICCDECLYFEQLIKHIIQFGKFCIHTPISYIFQSTYDISKVSDKYIITTTTVIIHDWDRAQCETTEYNISELVFKCTHNKWHMSTPIVGKPYNAFGKLIKEYGQSLEKNATTASADPSHFF
jgi:hypothetical protein